MTDFLFWVFFKEMFYYKDLTFHFLLHFILDMDVKSFFNVPLSQNEGWKKYHNTTVSADFHDNSFVFSFKCLKY